jgi:nucleotide-binding universal stress UspA family protein
MTASSVLRNILVPIDGSPPAIAALEHAVALAAEGVAVVDILHVRAPDAFAHGSTRPISATARREMDAAMEDAVERARGQIGERVAWRTVEGDPLRRIVSAAGDGAYDLVVIGTHGRVGRIHSMLGSVAEGVVRSAPCPVLTVREPGGEYQSFADRRHGRPVFGSRAPQHGA